MYLNVKLSKAILSLVEAKKLIDEAEAAFNAEGLKVVRISNEDYNDKKEIEVHLRESIDKVADGEKLQSRPPCFKGHERWDDYDWVNVEGINFIQKKGEPR